MSQKQDGGGGCTQLHDAPCQGKSLLVDLGLPKVYLEGTHYYSLGTTGMGP